jgi:hypothetical protein
MQEAVLNKIKSFAPKPRPRLIEPLVNDEVHETGVLNMKTIPWMKIKNGRRSFSSRDNIRSSFFLGFCLTMKLSDEQGHLVQPLLPPTCPRSPIPPRGSGTVVNTLASQFLVPLFSRPHISGLPAPSSWRGEMRGPQGNVIAPQKGHLPARLSSHLSSCSFVVLRVLCGERSSGLFFNNRIPLNKNGGIHLDTPISYGDRPETRTPNRLIKSCPKNHPPHIYSGILSIQYNIWGENCPFVPCFPPFPFRFL